ncbi:MAG: VOC family protein [Fibrobacteres bacterium]|nr:VOC family protein [Fibrobacterota bacterium]
MAAVNAYINFDGNCDKAFDFYKSVFGGDFQARMTFGEAPGMDVPPAQKNKLMHVALPIGKNTLLMGSDWSAQFGPMVRGNSFSLSVNADTQSEADKVFKALSDGGKVTMPIGVAFWGAYFGMCTDKFGINWMVNHEMKKA